MEEATVLYRGDFLCDFFLPDSAVFEEWAAARRAEFKRQVLDALDTLASAGIQMNDLERAQRYARQQLAIDNLRESAHRQLMYAQALSGQRNQALAEYARLKELLYSELGAEPSAETETLYQQLLSREPLLPYLAEAAVAARPPRKVGPCPYRGLAAFREEDAPFFFGREKLIQQLANAVRQRALVHVIVGSSGSGKSSVVYAGLLPQLREEESWHIAQARPGSQPFQATAAALLTLLEPDLSEARRLIESQMLSEVLTQGNVTLESIAKRILAKNGTGGRLLLLLDQFEEIYTLCPDDGLRRRFLDQLLAAVESSAQQRIPPLVFLLTLRADFMGQALGHRPFADALQDAAFMIGPMTEEELQQTIEKPAELQGAAFEEGLVERILKDVGQEPGHLPLLEFALTLLWEKQQDGWLSHGDYEEIGQVEGALARYADQVMEELSQEEQEQARRIFVQLVRPGQGTEDTRRVATRAELGEAQWPLVRHLADSRLVVTGRSDGEQETAEVVHEALIQRWGMLQGWMAEDRVFRTWQERLRAGLHSWGASEKDEGALLRGGPLAEAEGWLAERSEQMSGAEREYIEASVVLRQKREEEREAQRRRELEAAQALADTQRQAASRLRRSARYLVGALAVAAVLAIAAFFAFRQASDNADTAEANFELAATREVLAVVEAKQRATAEANALAEANQRATAQSEAVSESLRADGERDSAIAAQATSQAESFMRATAEADAVQERQEALRQASIGLGSQALLELASDVPERAPLLAIEALENYPYTWQAERALGEAVYASRLRLILQHELHINTVTWSPDGKRLATASDDGTAKVWDATTGEVIFTLEDKEWAVVQALWSPDGNRLLTNGKTLQVWDMATGELIFAREGHDPWTIYADWSPSGDRIFTTGWDDWTAKMWDATSGDLLFTLDGNESKQRTCGRYGRCTSGYSAWSPSGDRVVTSGEDGYVAVWDAETGQMIRGWLAHQGGVASVAWSPSGDRLATTGADGTAKTFDSATGQELLVIVLDPPRPGAGVLWSPSGDRLVKYGFRNAIFDAVTGEELVSLGNDFYMAVAWSADGDKIAVSSWVAGVSVRDSRTGEELQSYKGIEGYAPQLEWAPSGLQLAAADTAGAARVWRVDGPMKRREIESVGVPLARWSPDGSQIAYINSNSGQIQLIDEAHGQVDLVIEPGHQDRFNLSWSPSGDRLLTASWDGTARIWDSQSGELQLSISGHEGGISSDLRYAGWSPDGERVVTGGSIDQTVRIWDTRSGEQLLVFTGHVDGMGYNVSPSWSPDGSYIVSANNSGSAIIWDPNSGEIIHDLYPSDFTNIINCVAWSPDSSRLLIGSDDGKARVWDATAGTELLSLDVAIPSSCNWFPNGDRVLVGDRTLPLKVWDTTTGKELLGPWLPGVEKYAESHAELAPDGSKLLIILHPDGPVQLYDIWQSLDELLARARQCCVLRELTPAERELFGLPER